MIKRTPPLTKFCPCGSQKPYSDCCARYLEQAHLPADAERLMRSRYTAYTLGRNDYLLATWHPSSRPVQLDENEKSSVKWLGLEVKNHAQPDEQHATVEFIARYKLSGRAYRLHERSRFVCEQSRWFYVDGEFID